MRKKNIRSHVVWLMSVLIFTLTTGCANLDAIQKFGKLSADSAGYTKLTEEYASSPIRQKQYTFSSDSEQRRILDEQAERRQPQVQKLMLYQTTVSKYMNALASLAADDAVSFDENISGLANAAVKAKYIDEEKAKAVKSIATTIADAITDGYRQRELSELIDKANAPLQLVLNDMGTVVKAYKASLEHENIVAKRYFSILELMARKDDKQTAIAELIWARGVEQNIQLKDRVVAVDKYGEVLQKIAEAHQKLYNNRNKISDAEVQRQLRHYSKQIYAAYKLVQGE